MEQWYAPTHPAPLPQVARACVFAPHPDDEIFGCAGTLALLHQASADIRVHVLTDGAGYREPGEREQVRLQRAAETDRALAVLGIAPASHGGFLDRGLAAQVSLKDHLLAFIDQYQPELVFVPSLWEIHPDHLALARGLCAALHQRWASGQAIPSVMFYEIGAPQRTNCLIDISTVWPLKAAAMDQFPSQLAQQAYARQIEGLNRYRTYTLAERIDYAEAFCHLPANALAEIFAAGEDPAHRLIGRWADAALAAADAHGELLQQENHAKWRELQRQQAHIQRLDAELLRQCALANEHWQQVQQLNKRLEEAARTHENLRGQLRLAEQQISSLSETLANVWASNSWRITAPLRWLVSKLRA